MSRLDMHNEKLELLDNHIDELRTVLNEICVTTEFSNESLIVSERLDKLIVEYMKLSATQVASEKI